MAKSLRSKAKRAFKQIKREKWSKKESAKLKQIVDVAKKNDAAQELKDVSNASVSVSEEGHVFCRTFASSNPAVLLTQKSANTAFHNQRQRNVYVHGRLVVDAKG